MWKKSRAQAEVAVELDDAGDLALLARVAAERLEVGRAGGLLVGRGLGRALLLGLVATAAGFMPPGPMPPPGWPPNWARAGEATSRNASDERPAEVREAASIKGVLLVWQSS